MSARTYSFVKSLAAAALLGAVILPVAASAHDYDDDDDGYVVVHSRHHNDRCSGNTAGGVVTGAIIGGAAGAAPGAVVGAMIGGAIGSDTDACHYGRHYAYDDDDDYVYQSRGYDENAYDRDYNRRYSYSRSSYGYRDPYYGRRYRSDW